MNMLTQARVGQWVLKVFGGKIATDKIERAMRVVEEAIELGQAAGVTEAQARLVLQRVYSRAPGRLYQEVGGVGITLLAFGEAADIPVAKATEDELRRIEQPETIKRIREKQNEKAAAGTALRYTP